MSTYYASVFSDIVTTLQQTHPHLMAHIMPKGIASGESAVQIAVIVTILLKTYTFVILLFTLIAILLARNWQAMLYHSGGLTREIHTLRMPPYLAFGLFFAWIGSQMMTDGFAQIVSLGFCIPLLLAGMGLVHGLVALKKNVLQWRFMIGLIYLLLLFLYPLIATFALIDSVVDFRGRLKKSLNM